MGQRSKKKEDAPYFPSLGVDCCVALWRGVVQFLLFGEYRSRGGWIARSARDAKGDGAMTSDTSRPRSATRKSGDLDLPRRRLGGGPDGGRRAFGRGPFLAGRLRGVEEADRSTISTASKAVCQLIIFAGKGTSGRRRREKAGIVDGEDAVERTRTLAREREFGWGAPRASTNDDR